MLDETQARALWNDWTLSEKQAFIAFHEFNPRFASYAWAMLPYSVQQLVRAVNENQISAPRILGKCSECLIVYDLKGGMECPECGWSGLLWAYHANNLQEAMAVMESANQPEAPKLTEKEKQGIAELERMLGYYEGETK